MGLTAWLPLGVMMRSRLCWTWGRYLVVFSVLSVFLLSVHRWRPNGGGGGTTSTDDYFLSDAIFTGWTSIGVLNTVGGGREKAAGGGVSQILFGGKSKRCASSSQYSPELHDLLQELPVGRARYDNRILLRIYDYIRVGSDWEELISRYDVCLSTQSSIDRIYWLPQELEKWRGPLSVAVHVTSEEEWLVFNLYTKFLERCSNPFRDQVSIHVAMPAHLAHFCVDEDKLQRWNVSGRLDEIQYRNECHESKEYMRYLMETFPTHEVEKIALKEVYPQNHMRNIARKACSTDWTYSTDVDIIPRDGLAEMLQQLYEAVQQDPSPCEKCAFVIPTFELDESKEFPRSKEEIAAYFNAGSARQFHGKIFDVGHKATNYKKWTSTNLEDGPIKISHPITSSQAYLYEPFYISSDMIPPFDERFLGYGFTSNSQFQEAYLAGWNFSVLTPAFSIHWGLQTFDTLISPKERGVGKNVRRAQIDANSKLFSKILKEMKLKKQEGIF